MKRSLAALLALVLTSVGLPAGAESFVYLLPDSEGRYRPVVDNGGSAQVLADILSITPPALSPDETRVAFSGATADESFGQYAIFLVDADGSNLRRLTPGSFGEFDPAWSPDGDTLVISQNQTGQILPSSCCRLALVDVATGELTGLTSSNGAVRPSYSPDGSFIVYDTPQGVWRIPASGGGSTLVASGGFDAAVSPDGDSIAYLVRTGSGMELRVAASGGGSPVTVIQTSGGLENPRWVGSRVYFVAYEGAGYDARSQVRWGSVRDSGGGFRVERSFPSRAVGVVMSSGVLAGPGDDEMFFYREDGEFRFFQVRSDGSLPDPMLGGDGYTRGWSAITSIDLEGDGQDEMFFYRNDGLFRYYQIRSDGSLPAPMIEGDGYTRNWDAITAVDLDGDGQDEVFFYRDDGLFRYYQIRPNGALPRPILEGDGYTRGWDAITAVDLDGDGQDEMFFYRNDGLFRYYEVRPDGSLSSPLNAGSDYPGDWSSISAIDLDGDGQDEMFFYRESTGDFAFFDVDAGGELGDAIRQGSDYDTGWDVIISINLGPG